VADSSGLHRSAGSTAQFWPTGKMVDGRWSMVDGRLPIAYRLKSKNRQTAVLPNDHKNSQMQLNLLPWNVNVALRESLRYKFT